MLGFILDPKTIVFIAWGVIGLIAARDVGKRYGWGASTLLYSIYLGACPVLR